MTTISKKWLEAAGIRAIKTMAQTASAMIGTGMIAMNEVNWVMVASTSVVAGVLSILTSIGGLPEVNE